MGKIDDKLSEAADTYSKFWSQGTERAFFNAKEWMPIFGDYCIERVKEELSNKCGCHKLLLVNGKLFPIEDNALSDILKSISNYHEKGMLKDVDVSENSDGIIIRIARIK